MKGVLYCMKKILKYQCYDLIKVLVVYYVAIALILFLILAGLHASNSQETSRIGFAPEFFCFILGLCMFREYFHLFTQNGVSRKTIFSGGCVSLLLFSAVISVMDTLFLRITDILPIYKMKYINISSLLYSPFLNRVNTVTKVFTELILTFLVMYIFFSVGYLISIWFYRFPKPGKIGIAVGLPLLVIGGVPLLMVLFPDIFAGIFSFFLLIMGYSETSGGNPVIGMITLTVVSLAVTGLNYISVKGAQI